MILITDAIAQRQGTKLHAHRVMGSSPTASDLFQCFKTYYNVPTINLDVVMPG